MPFLSFLHFFSTLVYIYLIVFILIKNWKSPLNRICAVIFFCFALWCLGKTVTHNPYISEAMALKFSKIIILGAWTFSGFLFCFALIFTEKHNFLKKKWVYVFIFLIPVLSISEQLLNGTILTYVKRPFGWGLQWQNSHLTLLLLVYFFLSLILSVILILVYIKQAKSAIKKKQAIIIGFSTFIGFIIGYPTNILIPKLTSGSFPDLAHNMALIWAIGLVYAIVKYNFLVISPTTAAENIISTMTDTLILTDPKGNIVTMNKAGIELLDYKKTDLVGEKINTLFFENTVEYERMFNKIRSEALTGEDVVLKSSDGKSIPVSLSSSLLIGEESEIAGIVCIARDISDRITAEREMKIAKDVAEKASEAKSNFLANMSHELRTPMNHIIGFSELLLDGNFGELNANQEEFLNDIHGSSYHLLSLINDILDLSKVEAGRLELKLSSVNLRVLLKNSLFVIKEKTMKHGVSLSHHLNGITEIIMADERKLKQIMYNLLSNAAKFTPGGGKITLTAVPCDIEGEITSVTDSGEGNSIKVSITDTGIGIKPEDLDRIFNPFEQVEHSKSRMFQGTGLGLSLTKSLVELHGGKIWVESEGEGKGASFNFTIPTNLNSGSSD